MPNWPVIFHALFSSIFLHGLSCVQMIWAFGGLHPVGLSPVYLLLMCIWIYLPMCWWHACLNSCQWFPGSCFLYGCSGITSPLCTVLGEVCIQCVPYTGKCTTWYTVNAATVSPHSCWLLPPMVCGQWWCIFPWQNSNGGTSLGHVEFQGHLIPWYSPTAQHSWDFCWQEQLGRELHNLVPHPAHNSCHPLPALIWLQAWHLMHQFPGIGVQMCHIISCIHLCWLSSCCLTGPGTFCSIPSCSSLMSALTRFHIPLQSLVKTYLGSSVCCIMVSALLIETCNPNVISNAETLNIPLNNSSISY